MRRLLAASAAVAVVLVAAVAARGIDPVGGVTIERGIPYRDAQALDGSGKTRLKLDLYRPKAVNRAPVVIWVHGGGFAGGHREDMGFYAQSLAERGYVAATISYRLADPSGRRIPFATLVRAAEHDLAGAVRWFQRHSRGLDIDRRRIFVGGYSAGGVTSLRVALRGRPRVRGAVIIAGALSGGPIGRHAAPVIWFHGTRDRLVAYRRAQSGCRTARVRGAGCGLVTFRGVDHDIVIKREGEIVRRAAAWLRRR